MKRRKKKNNNKIATILVVIILAIIGIYYQGISGESYAINNNSYNLEDIPEYNGKDYVIINDNIPNFKEEDYNTSSFEKYSDLDSLGRCGVAYANISKDLMPTKERESIVSVKPTGWHTVRYDDLIEDKYLYNRCHLIGYQLTGENANPKNLITCTRYTNSVSMLEFENKVSNYIKKTNNHVLYRVTPIFQNNNLLVSGIEIEASSVEDKCGEICFHVYIYNIQQGIEIDYTTGDSKRIGD